MRLIDADKLKFGLSEKTRTDNEASRFIDIIDGQITAYDADKVVDEIEKIISSYELCVETSLKEIKNKGEDKMYFEIYSLHNNRGCLNGLKKALEIVKSGGK